MTHNLIIFDADGTLRRCTVEGQVCPNKPGEWELIPGVKEKIQQLIAEQPHVKLTVASNQAGVGLGYLDRGTAATMLIDMMTAITQYNWWHVQICPHKASDECICRKPKPGMLHHLMIIAGELPVNTLMVGDMQSDKDAAENAGCDFMWAEEFFK